MYVGIFSGKMLDLQHQYNNCTTIHHMRVGPRGVIVQLLYWCCTRIKSLFSGMNNTIASTTIGFFFFFFFFEIIQL
jgi:hypothetical protein